VSIGKNQTEARKYSLLIVVKGECKYLVKYNPESKSELFDLLLEYGMDDRYNLTSFDALTLIERIKGSKESASVISLSEEGFTIEPGLTLEDTPGEIGNSSPGREF